MISVGIDLGGTTIKGALVNEQGKILRKDAVATGAQRPWQQIMADINRLTASLIRQEGISPAEVKGVGMGVPGTADPERGVLVYACNLPLCRNMPAREAMQSALGLPLYLDNDANVAALGESLFGAGGGRTRCSVLITLGTGVGGGVIINGKIFAGAYYGGAELGHQVIIENGEPCSCGRKGCWEAYSSATGLIRSARQAALENRKSILWENFGGDLDKLNGAMIGEAADEKDPSARLVMEEYLRHLAIGLGNIYNIFQPEILILGGGISGRGEKLLAPLRELLAPEIYGGDMTKVDIRSARLGNDAGVIGAACLAMQS